MDRNCPTNEQVLDNCKIIDVEQELKEVVYEYSPGITHDDVGQKVCLTTMNGLVDSMDSAQ